MVQFTTQSGRYLVTSHGNGWAYEVVDLQTNDSLWFQDDDANEIREQTDHFEHEGNISVYFENLCE